MKIFAYPIVFIVSLFLYFNSSSIIAYAIFVIATLGLLYYDIRLVEKFREKTTWKYQKLRGQEAKDAEQKICNEYVTNDPLYQKIKSGNGTFDNLSGNFLNRSSYRGETVDNTFGIINGQNYGFDFSAGQRTSDLVNADIIFENEKIKSTAGNSIYLGNVERISSNLGPLQEFHLRDTVFDTQPVGEVGVKDFGFAFVKTREGNFAKVKLSTYSVDNKGNTILTIFWAYQPNGTKSLKSDYTDFVRGLDTYCARYQ